MHPFSSTNGWGTLTHRITDEHMKGSRFCLRGTVVAT